MYRSAYDFKIDAPKGEEAERTIAFLLSMNYGDLIEAKRDFVVSNTGNIAIEYECRGKKSGIAITKAMWWAILLNGNKYKGEVITIIKTERLRSLARKYIGTERDVIGGDDKSAKMILLPVEELLSAK